MTSLFLFVSLLWYNNSDVLVKYEHHGIMPLVYVWIDGMRWKGAIFLCLNQLKSDRVEQNGVVWISFHSITYHRMSSSSLRWNEEFVLFHPKTPKRWNEIFIPLCSISLRFILFRSIPLCSAHFMISKHSLNEIIPIPCAPIPYKYF